MIVAVDVDYRTDRVVTAAVGFTAWTDASSVVERVLTSRSAPADYEPGSFYKRELPYLLAILALVPATTVVIDGFVTLGAAKGLGAHLHEALSGESTVVGVAKRRWRGGSAGVVDVLRGRSQVALHVTAIGIDLDEAARHVAAMHGPHRTPTLLKRVDRLARDSDRA